MKDDLGNRMKSYENVSRTYLTRRTPVIIRIDGKAFHTFTRGFQKPFDMMLMEAMWETTKYLCSNIQGCKIGYTQSDEISLLLTDYESIDTCAWFDNNIQKIASVSASIATLSFNKAYRILVERKVILPASIDFMPDDKQNQFIKNYNTYHSKKDVAIFDSRVFAIPKEEVCNYFIWRQDDASRNSVQMVGRANFSHKQLNNKSCNEIQEILFTKKGINWNDIPSYQKRGSCIIKEKYILDNEQQTERSRWVIDKNIPIFTSDRDYIETYL